MNWLWPGFLLLLGLAPLSVAIYLWQLRRRRPALRYSTLLVVRQAVAPHTHLRRHIPFALFVLALSALALALARPVATVPVPGNRATVILALDVSRSMCATDIEPNRLEAAKAAALTFIQRQAAGPQIGIVAFAGFAEVVQTPTSDLELLEEAINGLTTARRTAIGAAILEAVDAIAEFNPEITPVTAPAGAAPDALTPATAFAPAIIVLLTDGVSNSGPLPLEAAAEAAARGIRVYTIGFGTEDNTSLPACGSFTQPGDPFGGGPPPGSFGFGSGFGGGFRRGIDEPTLRQVAAMTGGDYYAASSANELERVFSELPTQLITRPQTIEISVLFAGLGALLAALAVGLGLIWQPLP